MLPKINTILYACDLEGQTHSTLELVLSLAKSHQAKVVLMHAIEPLNPQAANMISTYITDEAMKSMQQESIQNRQNQIDKVLSDFMDKHAEELATLETPETLIITGYPNNSIQDVAAEKQADIIVMNSRTHSRLEQIMIGSTANKVIHSSQIPVLVVPIK